MIVVTGIVILALLMLHSRGASCGPYAPSEDASGGQGLGGRCLRVWERG